MQMQIVGYALIGIVLTVGMVVVSVFILSEDDSDKPDFYDEYCDEDKE